MNELQIFHYNGNEVRTVQIDGEPWWVLKDVCAVLDLSDTNKTAERLDADELTRIKFVSGGQNREMLCINESGLYNVILRSDKPQAKPFRKWVTNEVLPSIRKTGGYQLPQMSKELRAIIMQDQKIQEVEKRVDKVQWDLAEFKEEMPLLALDCDRISRAVHIKGVECLGGKDSLAYQDRSLRGKVYSDLHREIKRQFGVTTYKAIRRNQCDDVCRIVSEYELPMALQEQVDAENTNMLLFH
ncbi:ORF6C domain-containing protein [Anaerotignum lactatifermentans]|uniref:ORF6C domain-containing protein n=1 Tax=Anaerotignum lactatifermentans TaxID=160404 RepID=UPI00255C36EF|nr:ORF6C domain-containing protein [Anaerotignum lactatifermentans]